jgi:hypothetical protein
MHAFGINVLFNYRVFYMFRTTGCSSSGRLVRAVLWLMAGCALYPEDEHLDVRNMLKTL